MTRHRYDRQGMLAIEPKAFLWLFDEPKAATNDVIGDATIVEIRGPLEHHAGWWCDSYDSIRERVKAACESPASHIVLKIDSPGGDVSGCFETAREIRRMAAAAGKTLVAYADGQACSGGYALACAGAQIIVPKTGFVGSVGVINTRVDVTNYDAKEGFRFAITTSGARKADGHPHTPISEGESAATQTIVNSLAEVFFDLVAELRGMPAAKVAALEAGVFHGDAAISAGLADQVLSFDELLEAINSGAFRAKETSTMASKVDEARAALEEAAKGEGAEADKAKRALAAMDEGDEEKAESEDDDEEASSEAEDEEPPADDEEEEEEASASASAGKVSAKTAAELAMLAPRVAKLEQENRAASVARFLATRPDLPKALVKTLASKPLADVKAIVGAIPKPKVPARAAAAQAIGTRGATQGGDRIASLPPDEKQELDRKMGLVQTERVVTNTGAIQQFGALKVKGA